MEQKVTILPGEHWWSGASRNAVEMPLYFGKEPLDGGGTVEVPASIDVLPYFIKAQ